MSEKVIPATPRRKKEAREKGQVAKSAELTSLIILICTLAFIYIKKDNLINIFKKSLYFIGYKNVSISLAMNSIKSVIFPLFICISIPFLCGFLGNILQIGFLISFESIKPDFNKINPVSGFKRMFSKQSAFELLKSSIKIIVVLFIIYIEIKKQFFNFISLFTLDMYTNYTMLFNLIFKICSKIFLFMFLVAIADFSYKKFDFNKNLKMTLEEFKRELKQDEGSPEIKQKQREFQHKLSKKQIKKVKEATVVIVNPTHIAVALKYEEKMPSPMVIFKGEDFIALEIKKIAKEGNIPIVKNIPLARTLYSKCKEGNYITDDLFDAVAETLAYVYSLKK